MRIALARPVRIQNRTMFITEDAHRGLLRLSALHLAVNTCAVVPADLHDARLSTARQLAADLGLHLREYACTYTFCPLCRDAARPRPSEWFTEDLRFFTGLADIYAAACANATGITL